ncbi:MAG: hypothetical protein JW751_26105 [Polyangiaceae bacterium]|nr:hypothetical protein [Polyangiaceae bacterium]
MRLEDLMKSVTNAILRAETFPADSWEAQHEFREVAELEEEIATIVGAQTIDGEIARLGAVTAALSAGEPLRAIHLAQRYRIDVLSDAIRAKLDSLVHEAVAEIERNTAGVTIVEPVRFRVRAGQRYGV